MWMTDLLPESGFLYPLLLLTGLTMMVLPHILRRVSWGAIPGHLRDEVSHYFMGVLVSFLLLALAFGVVYVLTIAVRLAMQAEL